MATLNGQELIRRIADRGPEAVYLIHGRERWFADRALELLKEALFSGPGGEASRSVNYDVFAGRETKAEGLATAARTMPMFSQRRLVVVRQAHKVTAPEWKAFSTTYFDNPIDTTTLVVDWGERKPDGRTKWVKGASKNGVVAECKPLYDNEVPSFLRFAAGRSGKELTPGAAAFLAQSVGSDLHALADAIERLALFVGDAARIEEEDVGAAIATTKAHEVWDLTDAVANGDLPGALTVLGRVRAQGAEAPQLLFHLHRTVRQLWLAKEAVANGADRQGLGKALGVHPYVAGKVADSSRRFTIDALAEALIAVADAEVATRTGGLKGPVKDWVVMESLVQRLCAPRG